MVQPKTPPISIRIPAELLADIDALAERKNVTRHAAILWALVRGEAADRGVTPESVAKLIAEVKALPGYIEPEQKLRMPRAAYGSLSKTAKTGKAKR